MQRDELLARLNGWLEPEKFKDYAPNGLQVQGRAEISRIVTAVSATQTVIDKAVELQADALLVHHGWFWRGEDSCLIGVKKNRIKSILAADINLIAYHLPLDAHPEMGNNACLGKLLHATHVRQSGEGDFVWSGEIEPTSVRDLSQRLSKLLHRPVLVLGNEDKQIHNMAWCSGAAADFLDEAIAIGAGAYLSGEAAERSTHLARESGVPFLVCGHHATERFGIQALGARIEKEFGLECIFVDDDNPI